MDTISRIFELLSLHHMEQKELASQIGIMPQTVTDWKNGKSKSYTKYIPQIATILGTTTEYLLTGEGPKKRGIPRNAVIKISGRHQISESARDVAFAYDDASPELQAAVRRVLGLD